MKKLLRPKVLDISMTSGKLTNGENAGKLIPTTFSSAITEFTDCFEYRIPKCKISNFLRIYFSFAYYTCCCPFRFTANPNGWFSIKTWKPQQVSLIKPLIDFYPFSNTVGLYTGCMCFPAHFWNSAARDGASEDPS